MPIKLLKQVKGFTLVEMMVAITVFLIITLSAMGLIATIMTAQRKAQAEQDYVVNLSESLFSVKNELRKYTGYKLLDLGTTQNFGSNSACNGAQGFGETIGMLDDNLDNVADPNYEQTLYILTTQKVNPIAGQESVRLVLTKDVDSADPTKYTVMLPLIKDLSIYSICFKPIGDGEIGETTVHPRVTVLIKARTVVPSGSTSKDYTFQFTVESRNIVNIQNVYNSTWQ